MLLQTETGNSNEAEETHMEHIDWQDFASNDWQNEINLRDFIQCNYREYTGDEAFLAGPTLRTQALM